MRVLAIGDIHGCSYLLDDLLAWIEPGREDQIVILGDVVDRGPDTRGVLDRLIAMKRDKKNLITLRGNHEIMMLSARDNGRGARAEWLSVGGGQTLGSYGKTPGWSGTLEDIPDEHWKFIESQLLNYYENKTHIFVHASVSPQVPLEEQPGDYLFWEYLPEEMKHISGKRVICGHTSQKSGEVKVIPGAVCIDTFAHGGGWLTCLDTGSGHYWQVNLTGQRREGEAGVA